MAYPSLNGKVIAISGAASGMGLALAKLLYPMGCKLSLTDINIDGLNAAIPSITSTDPPTTTSSDTAPSAPNVITSATDVRSSSQVDAWIAKTVKELGGLDGAANFAGIAGKFQSVMGIEDEEWKEVQEVNVDGIFFALRAQLRAMTQDDTETGTANAKGGSIINTASVAGLKAGYAGANYTMSKHGVIGITKAAAREVGHLGVRVNAIAP
ncbi:NAD(P)-binding protein [Decorospora gaudefroyi]|uniref:NAD(P)-binding protein n=1 Tax=Decorospora gaudefroyi TaxID=184978 RepID=A0A6A5KIM1_9PLEO|nr:NAD(P)-binding protein [Decorospora gaudefroyi]